MAIRVINKCTKEYKALEKKVKVREFWFYIILGLITLLFGLYLQFTISHWFAFFTFLGLVYFTFPFWKGTK